MDSVPFFSSKPPKPGGGFSSSTAASKGVDYFQSLAETHARKVRLRKLQEERASKVLQEHVAQDLFEIVRRKVH